MVRWMAAAVCVVAMANSGMANAADPEVRRLTVDLDWQHLPRTEHRGEMPKSRQRALVPNGELRFTRWSSGDRTFVIEFDDGVACSTSAEKTAVASLECGTNNAFYSLLQIPGRQAKLEWVTIGAQATQVVQQ